MMTAMCYIWMPYCCGRVIALKRLRANKSQAKRREPKEALEQDVERLSRGLTQVRS